MKRHHFSLLAAAALAVMTATANGDQFALLIYETPDELAARTDDTRGAAYWKAFADYGAALQSAGIIRGGAALQPNTGAKTVTVRDDESVTTDGPHAQSSTQLGGYFVIEVPTLDEALQWAAKAPSSLTGAVEVRPFYPVPGMP